jgi:antitoxin component YwqK of YwqJK toxin-antitoxin module
MTAQKKITLITFLTLLILTTVQAQELYKKKKYKDGVTEEFYVIKEDKTIRHGPSLTRFKDILDNICIIEFGYYTLNKKSGKWLTFYFADGSNSLKSIGNYDNDLKSGDWKYYYAQTSSGKSIQNLFMPERKADIVKTKNSSQAFQIEYDTVDLRPISAGKYENDNKIGIWNYYSRSGYLIHSYNHDSKELTTNNLRDGGNDFLIYLGGPERFVSLFHIGQQEMRLEPSIVKTSEIILEVDWNGGYTVINAYGDENYKVYILQILSTIPNDWILLNKESKKKLQLKSKVVVTENAFNRFRSTLDFNLID